MMAIMIRMITIIVEIDKFKEGDDGVVGMVTVVNMVVGMVLEENNNERNSRDETLEDSIGGDGEIIAEASIVTERETGEDDAQVKPKDATTASDGVESSQTVPVAETSSTIDEGERRQEEREALRSLEEALGRDAISEGGSSIMEPTPAHNALSQQETGENVDTHLHPEKAGDTVGEQGKHASNAETAALPGTLSAPGETAATESKTDAEEVHKSDHSNLLLKQTSEESTFSQSLPASPVEATAVAVPDSILSDEFRGMRLKSDDNSSLGEISVDPRLDTGSGLDGLIPSESPVGIDALDGAGSDEDSDYPEESNLPSMGQGEGFGKISTFLTGKRYSGAQLNPLEGDVSFRKRVPNALQGSSKDASPLEMVISSKMASDTQEELVSTLDKIRTLQAKVTDVEGDVSEAQSYALEARKEAMEAKDEAIKAKQQATEAMAEALEAKKDASLKRQEIQAISLRSANATATTGPLSQLTDNILAQNSAPHSSGEGESLGFIPSGSTDDLSSIVAGSNPGLSQVTSNAVDQVSSVAVDNVTNVTASVSNTVEDGLGAVRSETRAIAQQGSAIAGKVGDGLQDVRAAAMLVKSGLTFSSIWGEFFVRLCLLLVTIGASGHLIVAIVKTIDDQSYIKLGVYAFILVCIFLPAACLLIYLLVKSNVSALYKATRELNAARKLAHTSTVTFSDHVVELPPLNHHQDNDAEDGLEEISLGSVTSETDTTPITRASSDVLQDGGTPNPAFENNINV
ncbi:hypothetical protein ElyMa_001789000 [Elysia marginata]|uniref:Uncharacterized protein n=1 Tax=Elysia marginata TaxID=1093978 RepID=A0AAV4EDV9_9GAST|nr:hypothetical protein ElyMa_001789000 [Elysia marginata]